MIKKIIDFFKHGVWQKQESEARTKKERWLVRASKVVVYTVQGLGEHDVSVRAAALTFFTLMSVVPVAALVFAVVKGFGLEANLTDYLYTQFSNYSQIIDYILQFANNMLGRVKGGVVAIVGFVVLLWSVVQVFGNVENAFNNIWEIKKQRSLARKFSDYLAVVFITPVLWLISNSLLVTIRRSVETVAWSWVSDIIFGLLSLVAIWLMFAFVYYVMPNTKVKFKGALVAGVIAGTLFHVFQIGYVFVQSYLTSYNVIYGSFAALPLFLIWLQWSWMILLVGAELSYAYQNIGAYEQERRSMHMSYDNRRKVMLAVMVTIAEHFIYKQGPVSSEQVAGEIRMPVRIVRDVLFDLERSGMVATVAGGDEMVSDYVPARDIHSITIADVLEGVETHSSSQIDIDFEGNERLQNVFEAVERLKITSEKSPYNLKITDMVGKSKGA